MAGTQLPGIVKEPGPLSEEWHGGEFPGRTEKHKELLEGLTPLPGERDLAHVWLHGPQGSGKTSAIRLVLGKMEERGTRTAYVNCWSAQTFFAVMETIFQELRALVGDQRDVAFKYERLERLARERPLVIALDEVDQMFLRERNATLYNIVRLEGAGLACLSQSREAYLALDARVQSRLQPSFLGFPAYSPEELIAILEERANRGLAPESWCRADLEVIARAASGDARVAIQTLRIAAYLAEKAHVPQIRAQDVIEGQRQGSGLKRQYHLKGLSDHHRLLYQLVRASPRLTVSQLWKDYQAAAGKHGLEPMARRTFNYYKQYLVGVRLLEERQGRGRGNRRMLWAVE